jgi:DNA (cytosine-5)-methyltransferase 1
MIARCDGKPIVWPEPTHGDPDKYPDRKPWKTAADCIDWGIKSHSIFMSKEEGKYYGIKRPLAEKTLARIAKGIKKFIVDNPKPYIVKKDIGYTTEFVSTYYGGEATARGSKADSPVGTITAGGLRHSLVTAFVAQHNLGNVGRSAQSPISTITTTGSQQQLVTAEAGLIENTEEVRGYVMKMRNGNIGFGDNSPVHTVTAGGGHFAQVNAFIMKYYGQGEGSDVDEPAHTVTTKERFAIVEICGEKYAILDICMRMFTPRELYRAQGFPDTYKIDIEYNGKKLSKSAQVRMCGNSVVPQVAKAIVEANMEKEVAYG